MYCPNCGTQASADQRFCRSCGLSLRAISHVLSGHVPAEGSDSALIEVVQRFRSRRRKALRWGFGVFWSGIVVAALFGIVGNAMQTVDQAAGRFIEDLAGIGGMILLVGIGLMIYSAFLPRMEAIASAQQPTVLPEPEAPATLPAEHQHEPVPSVTEHTTVRLDAPGGEAPRRPV